ncbi:carbohydrate-binding protein [Streptomyces olivoreticuli]|uniref:carbohydrate-binding protein n=1 Tax=Streptomyces olivoreticuli TaxID=68246 RepID=UPI0026586B6B|nr:carbohydrate-binding protein [Streptomyces olivoreticuli]WKK26498.1 carbohydrate-binding protein [Streptomyces olivoreticuli]
MTAGNNGSGTPEGDDPFAHLYRSEGGDGNTDSGPAAHQPGVPRTSYHQVRTVGSRQYGQQNQTYGGQQPPHQPAPHYAAPETLPGGTPRQPGPPSGGHGGHGGPQRPKRRGLLIAAIAVVVVVAGGIGAAMITNSGNDTSKTNADGGDNKPKPQDGAKSKEPEKKDEPSNSSAAGLQRRDAATLNLSGGATTEKTVKGAQADGGLYITGMNKVGAAVEWQVKVDADGEYRLDARYGVPGTDANLTITINDKPESRPINMKNFGGTKDWENGWKGTWSLVQLKKGENSIKLSCEQGNSCDVHLDQLSISKN